jgi:hypothetical protein
MARRWHWRATLALVCSAGGTDRDGTGGVGQAGRGGAV